MPQIVIAGGSGFLGRSLARHLTSNASAEVTLLSRNEPTEPGPWRFQRWDARTLGDWVDVLDGVYTLVNLVGRTVDCIKTPENREEIMNSRVEATRVLGEAMHQVPRPPSVWVQMSTGETPYVIATKGGARQIRMKELQINRYPKGHRPEVVMSCQCHSHRGPTGA